jgi:hypothetical protein
MSKSDARIPGSALVCSCHYHKILLDWVIYKWQKFIAQSSERVGGPMSSGISVWRGLVLGFQEAPSSVFSHGGRGKQLPKLLLQSLREPSSRLNRLLKAPLLMLPHWWIGFNIWILRGDIQTVAVSFEKSCSLLCFCLLQPSGRWTWAVILGDGWKLCWDGEHQIRSVVPDGHWAAEAAWAAYHWNSFTR